jgi:hypothetical protein
VIRGFLNPDTGCDQASPMMVSYIVRCNPRGTVALSWMERPCTSVTQSSGGQDLPEIGKGGLSPEVNCRFCSSIQASIFFRIPPSVHSRWAFCSLSISTLIVALSPGRHGSRVQATAQTSQACLGLNGALKRKRPDSCGPPGWSGRVAQFRPC